MNDALANGRGHEKHDGKSDLRSIEPLATDIINDMMTVQDGIVIDFEERSIFFFAKLFDDERFTDLPGTFQQQALSDLFGAALFFPLEKLTVYLAFEHQDHLQLSQTLLCTKFKY